MVIDHILAALEQADVGQEPYTNISFEGCLPADLYQNLLDTLPSYDTLPQSSPRRKMLRLDNKALWALDGCWKTATGALESKQVKEAIFELLAEDIKRGRGEYQLDSIPAAYLIRDNSNFHIAPHCDAKDRYATMQVCLPPDDSQRNLGTELLDTNKNPVKKFEFMPNQAHSWAITGTSWHQCSNIGKVAFPRNQILVLFYGGSFNG